MILFANRTRTKKSPIARGPANRGPEVIEILNTAQADVKIFPTRIMESQIPKRVTACLYKSSSTLSLRKANTSIGSSPCCRTDKSDNVVWAEHDVFELVGGDNRYEGTCRLRNNGAPACRWALLKFVMNLTELEQTDQPYVICYLTSNLTVTILVQSHCGRRNIKIGWRSVRRDCNW